MSGNRIADPGAHIGSRLVGDVDFKEFSRLPAGLPQSWRCGPDDHCHADANTVIRRTSDRLLKVCLLLPSASLHAIALATTEVAHFYGSI